MINKENKKLIFGIILAALVFLSYQVIASYMTNPVDSNLKYPNPGHYPGEIGPGTFNASNSANPYWSFPDSSGDRFTGLEIINGEGQFYRGLQVDDYVGAPIDFLVHGNTQLGDSSSDKTTVKGDLNVTGKTTLGGSVNANNWINCNDYRNAGNGILSSTFDAFGNPTKGWWMIGDVVKISGDLEVNGDLMNVIQKYDIDNSGQIEHDEAVTAVSDYFSGKISKRSVMAIIKDYKIYLTSSNTSAGVKIEGDLNVTGGIVSLNDIVANYKAKIESYDTNNNDIVDTIELLTAIEDWKAGKTSEKVLNIMILLWKQDSSISGLPGSIGVDNYNVFASNNDTLYSGYFTGGKGVKIEGDLNVTGGIVVGNPDEGNKGAGTINAEKIYVNGSEVGGGCPAPFVILSTFHKTCNERCSEAGHTCAFGQDAYGGNYNAVSCSNSNADLCVCCND